MQNQDLAMIFKSAYDPHPEFSHCIHYSSSGGQPFWQASLPKPHLNLLPLPNPLLCFLFPALCPVNLDPTSICCMPHCLCYLCHACHRLATLIYSVCRLTCAISFHLTKELTMALMCRPQSCSCPRTNTLHHVWQCFQPSPGI